MIVKMSWFNKRIHTHTHTHTHGTFFQSSQKYLPWKNTHTHTHTHKEGSNHRSEITFRIIQLTSQDMNSVQKPLLVLLINAFLVWLKILDVKRKPSCVSLVFFFIFSKKKKKRNLCSSAQAFLHLSSEPEPAGLPLTWKKCKIPLSESFLLA